MFTQTYRLDGIRYPFVALSRKPIREDREESVISAEKKTETRTVNKNRKKIYIYIYTRFLLPVRVCIDSEIRDAIAQRSTNSASRAASSIHPRAFNPFLYTRLVYLSSSSADGFARTRVRVTSFYDPFCGGEERQEIF